jgi:hypothetical protein
VYWRGLLVTALDGTMMCCPDTAANLRMFRKGGGHHGGTGYPMVRMLALLACGTRTVIDATFGSSSVGETTNTRDLLRAMHPGMIVLADRNFACQALLAEIVETGAEVLVRVKTGRNSRSAAGCATVHTCCGWNRPKSASSTARSRSPPARAAGPGSTGW